MDAKAALISWRVDYFFSQCDHTSYLVNQITPPMAVCYKVDSMFIDSSKPLPLQLYQLGTDKLTCHCALPSQRLSAFIYYYWWLDVADGETTLEVIPDNATDLVMSPSIDDFSIVYLPSSEKFSI